VKRTLKELWLKGYMRVVARKAGPRYSGRYRQFVLHAWQFPDLPENYREVPRPAANKKRKTKTAKPKHTEKGVEFPVKPKTAKKVKAKKRKYVMKSVSYRLNLADSLSENGESPKEQIRPFHPPLVEDSVLSPKVRIFSDSTIVDESYKKPGKAADRLGEGLRPQTGYIPWRNKEDIMTPFIPDYEADEPPVEDDGLSPSQRYLKKLMEMPDIC
jgi:hypothetical protein